MNSPLYLPPRRKFIRQSIVGAVAVAGLALFTTPGLFAEELLTPPMTEAGELQSRFFRTKS